MNRIGQKPGPTLPRRPASRIGSARRGALGWSFVWLEFLHWQRYRFGEHPASRAFGCHGPGFLQWKMCSFGGLMGICVLLCDIMRGIPSLMAKPTETLAAESTPTAPASAEDIPKPGSSSPTSSSVAKAQNGSAVASNSPGAESQWLTDLLRQEFHRWLTSQSEELFNQFRTEFGRWLALWGSQPSSAAPEPNRPAWVDAPPGLIDGQYCQTVKAGPAPTLEDCQQELRSEIQKVIASYAEKRFDSPFAHRIAWNIDPLLPELVAAQWQETRLIDFGADIGEKPMIWLYAQLRFSRPVQEEIYRQYRQALIQSRLRTLAGIGAGVLLLLSLSYGVLRWQCNRLYPPKAS